jgi:hypothetical protein
MAAWANSVCRSRMVSLLRSLQKLVQEAVPIARQGWGSPCPNIHKGIDKFAYHVFPSHPSPRFLGLANIALKRV